MNEYETEYAFNAVIRDTKVIAVLGAEDAGVFVRGFLMAGGNLEELEFKQVEKFVTIE